MSFPVLLDACVLLPIKLADTLLRLAEAGTYRPLWSAEVLAEVERNLPRVGVLPARASWRVRQMRAAFPDALVAGYETLTPVMPNDPKDRHVLAAAVKAHAALIVTANLRDFPAPALDRYDIRAIHPDDFLLDQFCLYPASTLLCLHEQIAACRNPELSITEFLTTFKKTVPRFADAVWAPLLSTL
ncbi:PIN domain-containing protein [Crossiella sp. CA198]|uniref:PIN domain-containing protein n=1 Tax=Crossiella sp. CA198 TaxID=3455607 RepID=UPI003F8D6B9B